MLLWWDYFLRDPGWSLVLVPLSLSTFRSLIFSSISAVFGLVSHHETYIVCLRCFFPDWDPMGWKSPLFSTIWENDLWVTFSMNRFTMTTPHATRRVLGGEHRRRWFWFRCAENDSMCRLGSGWKPGNSSRHLFGVVKWPLKWFGDLQLGNQKVTLNHLEVFFVCARWFKPWFLDTLNGRSPATFEFGSRELTIPKRGTIGIARCIGFNNLSPHHLQLSNEESRVYYFSVCFRGFFWNRTPGLPPPLK